jgi:hypothetical protein
MVVVDKMEFAGVQNNVCLTIFVVLQASQLWTPLHGAPW